MREKIAEGTLPETWRETLVDALRFPPLVLEWKRGDISANMGDAILRVTGPNGVVGRFAVIYRRNATPLRTAFNMVMAKAAAIGTDLLPLLLVPYLSEELLLELESEQISGLDLCGNGVLIAPGKFTFFRTGYLNRFTSSRPLKNVYRDVSSLVARTFLLQPNYSEVGELQQKIAQCGGVVSPATVSKVLRELEEDQIILRVRQADRPQTRALTLLQPDKLLRRLEDNYAPPRLRNTFLGKVNLDPHALQEALCVSAQRSGVRLIATGIGSASRYASLAMENTLSVYTDDLESLIQYLPAVPTPRFPNLSIQETDDPTVFFDPRPDEEGFPWASPITALLEMAHGEQRLAQSAEQVRERLLRPLKEKNA
jgi:DNA-binding HxlR family transcriptional regulator